MSEFGTGRQSLIVVDSPAYPTNISFWAEVLPVETWEGLTVTLTANGRLAYSGFVKRWNFQLNGSISRAEYFRLKAIDLWQSRVSTGESSSTAGDFVVNFATEVGEIKATAEGRTWFLVPSSGSTSEDDNPNLLEKVDVGGGNTFYRYYNSVQCRMVRLQFTETGQGLYNFEMQCQETRPLLASEEVYPQ